MTVQNKSRKTKKNRSPPLHFRIDNFVWNAIRIHVPRDATELKEQRIKDSGRRVDVPMMKMYPRRVANT
jgi:hypothetical protein